LTIISSRQESSLDRYSIYRTDLASDPLYVVNIDKDGDWYVFKYTISTGLGEFAAESNNPTVTTAAAAFTARATLTYGDLSQVTIP